MSYFNITILNNVQGKINLDIYCSFVFLFLFCAFNQQNATKIGAEMKHKMGLFIHAVLYCLDLVSSSILKCLN